MIELHPSIRSAQSWELIALKLRREWNETLKEPVPPKMLQRVAAFALPSNERGGCSDGDQTHGAVSIPDADRRQGDSASPPLGDLTKDGTGGSL